MPEENTPIENSESTVPATGDLMSEVARKISEAHNILVALSSDPSVDEMASAIGLSLYLDKIGKHTVAIYSGETPNALQFLKPDETFENTADVLQDFVIALNKEKADHLRYKIDGDFVKIYITPYLARISEEDLEFSYGDFNVDLVLALDVANGVDLDAALREHGRIMHDATIVNITTGNPGKLGEIEWSDKKASSVSEMVARLVYGMGAKTEIGKEAATAFLTGIVAATNRFSGANTTSETMVIASRLMKSGADQQLISRNVSPDMENELFGVDNAEPVEKNTTDLDIEHDDEKVESEEKTPEEATTETTDVETPTVGVTADEKNDESDPTLLDDIKAAEADLALAGAETTPEVTKEPLKIESDEPKLADNEEPKVEAVEPEGKGLFDKPEKVVQPSEDFAASESGNTEKYGQMIEDALAESESANSVTDATESNPATAATPNASTAPEINGVPEINYMPLPSDEVLPPPPAPPIDFGTTSSDVAESEAMSLGEPTPAVIEPATSTAESAPDSLGEQPAMQDQVYNAAANNPETFQIPTSQQ